METKEIILPDGLGIKKYDCEANVTILYGKIW